MVIKKCKICGKEFEARGSALCCSPECSKENTCKLKAQWYKDNRKLCLERKAQWYKDNREYKREYDAQRYKDNRDEVIEKAMLRELKIVSELCEQYDGDLEQILEHIPNQWQIREAKMRVWFGESYYEGMIAKIKFTPVCEVTGFKDNLEIHHLYSFNTHPQLGNDVNNMVRITSDIHKKFHSIYGKGYNTPEQWLDFVGNL